MESPDDDPLAPLVAILVIGTILALCVVFVLITGGGVAPKRVWATVLAVAPWYAAGTALLLGVRWYGRKKRR
jgi:hypothetical protein